MVSIQHKNNLVARIVEYRMPPFRDALIMGRESSIGCHAMRRALSLLAKTPFAHIEIDDPVISDILVRESLLRRITQDQLIEFVLSHVKPLLGSEDVLQVELDIEVTLATAAA
jgi:hypothetical protein